ncbi:MAG: LysM peptidoglycan-binding domain-containing protein [Pseudomonadales bacterium]
MQAQADSASPMGLLSRAADTPPGGASDPGSAYQTLEHISLAQLAPRPVPAATPRLEVQPPRDLWTQLRHSFQLDHRLERKRVQQELSWLRRHPSYLPGMQARLQRYLPYILNEVATRGLPGELVLLPIVESALDPYAFSHGGAAGLWQFIPATGKRFGLTRNWWYDGRRDPLLATQAALTYLEYLNTQFDDWYLAVAGYNAGEGTVNRALRRAAGERDFFELRLPRETGAYVPRLLALAAAIEDPAAYGIELPPLSPEPAFQTVKLPAQFDLMKLADTLALDVETLYDYNPALNQWATPPDGPYHLHLPATLPRSPDADAQAKIDAVPAQQRVNWLRVRIEPGDTLSGIAARYGTDVATVRRANNLSGSAIRAGRTLLIPRSKEVLTAYPVARRGGTGDYVVRSGDSLWSIAKAHNVSVDSLVRSNHVGPKEVLRVGQRLTVPGAKSSPLPSGRDEVVRKVRYGVRSGDSLARIASRFNVSVGELARWNQLNTEKYLQPGQSLLIYVSVAGGE